MPKERSYPESSAILRFDLFEFPIDDLLYPQGLLVEMGQFAGTFQPRFVLPQIP